MNVLQVTQEFCKRTGIPVPTYLVGNPDTQVAQICGGLNELAEDLVGRKVWQITVREKAHTSIAGEDQGDIYTLTDSGCQYILQDTMFDRTQNLRLVGGLRREEWQARKALQSTGPLYEWRIRNDRLLFSPELPADHSIAWEYVTSHTLVDESDVTKEYITADTDSFRFPNRIPILWLRWWWKKEKRLDYVEEFRMYEVALADLAARDAAPRAVDMSARESMAKPGIIIPEGNWNLP